MMLGTEKVVQQLIDPQQPLAGERHAAVGEREVAAGGMPPQRLGKTGENIDAELLLKVARLDLPKLQQENELANQVIVIAKGQATGDGQFAAGGAV